jgi:hypothetical protein
MKKPFRMATTFTGGADHAAAFMPGAAAAPVGLPSTTRELTPPLQRNFATELPGSGPSVYEVPEASEYPVGATTSWTRSVSLGAHLLYQGLIAQGRPLLFGARTWWRDGTHHPGYRVAR